VLTGTLPSSRRERLGAQHVADEDLREDGFIPASRNALTDQIQRILFPREPVRFIGALRSFRCERIVVVGQGDDVYLPRPPAALLGAAIEHVVVAVPRPPADR
jgi:hypothetical protein